MTADLIIATILILIIGILMILLVMKNRQIKYYKIVSKNLSAMRVIQSMFEIMGANISAESKIVELNKIILDTYKCKYSSIVTFDGTKYNIMATNVENTFIESLTKIGDEEDFKNNILKNVSKYMTTTEMKTLRYKSAIERNIKSCMFSPIYHSGIFLGFWIIEDEIVDAFDLISKNELTKLKNSLGVFLENTLYETLLENADDIDKQTGFYNNLYIYSKARKKIFPNENNTICMMNLINMPEINVKYGREIGNKLLIKVINVVKENMTSENICVRYTGTKFVFIFPNSIPENVHSIIERILSRVKSEVVEMVNDECIDIKANFVLKALKRQCNIEAEINDIENKLEKIEGNNVIRII